MASITASKVITKTVAWHVKVLSEGQCDDRCHILLGLNAVLYISFTCFMLMFSAV